MSSQVIQRVYRFEYGGEIYSTYIELHGSREHPISADAVAKADQMLLEKAQKSLEALYAAGKGTTCERHSATIPLHVFTRNCRPLSLTKKAPKLHWFQPSHEEGGA